MKVSTSVVIDRSPEDVFAFITDLRNAPDWSVEVTEVRYDGDLEKGATGTDVRRMGRKTVEMPWEVVEFEPPRRVVFAYTVPFRATAEFRVEQNGSGTRLTCNSEAKPHGLWRLAVPMLRRESRRNDELQFARVKAIMEARG